MTNKGAVAPSKLVLDTILANFSKNPVEWLSRRLGTTSEWTRELLSGYVEITTLLAMRLEFYTGVTCGSLVQAQKELNKIKRVK